MSGEEVVAAVVSAAPPPIEALEGSSESRSVMQIKTLGSVPQSVPGAPESRDGTDGRTEEWEPHQREGEGNLEPFAHTLHRG
ncbi:unnamed protein product [Arctogadus glacialis]